MYHMVTVSQIKKNENINFKIPILIQIYFKYLILVINCHISLPILFRFVGQDNI